MFESLSDKFDNVFKKLSGQARLSEDNIREAMREVRMALLEADVNFKVVKDFTREVTEQAVGVEVLKSIRPEQQIIKVVHDELVKMLGGEAPEFKIHRGQINVILLLGLQGSGKTTFAGKLAGWLARKGDFKPMLVACDVYRPAAVQQLRVIGRQIGAPVYDMGTDVPVLEIARKALEKAKVDGRDVVIIDTAGRLHIDEIKMDELIELKTKLKPGHTFLVADSMTGQDAVNSAAIFNDQVGIDGVCLTKVDGDARGGAALSIRAVTGKPIHFMGVGEKLEDLEPFHPDRIASRILGMGDVVSLVERAQENFDEAEAVALQKKMKRQEFSLDDFLDQMQKIKKMGSLSSLLKMIPGMGAAMKGIDIPDDAFKPMEAMIRSMTPEERRRPDILDGNRRKRIALGSGRTAQEVNNLLREFDNARKMMGSMLRGGPGGAMGSMLAGGAPMGGRRGGEADSKSKSKHRRKQVTKKSKKK